MYVKCVHLARRRTWKICWRAMSSGVPGTAKQTLADFHSQQLSFHLKDCFSKGQVCYSVWVWAQKARALLNIHYCCGLSSCPCPMCYYFVEGQVVYGYLNMKDPRQSLEHAKLSCRFSRTTSSMLCPLHTKDSTYP